MRTPVRFVDIFGRGLRCPRPLEVLAHNPRVVCFCPPCVVNDLLAGVSDLARLVGGALRLVCRILNRHHFVAILRPLAGALMGSRYALTTALK